MSLDKPWKFTLVLIGIFLAGTLTGGALAVRFGRKLFPPRPAPEQWAPNHMRRLVERLGLTPEQQEQLQPIVRRDMEELNRLRLYSFTETRAVFERMERDIVEKLTPEQKVKFEQFTKELRERAQRFQQDRGGRPFGPGDGPRRFGPEDGRDRQRRERPPGDTPPKPPGG